VAFISPARPGGVSVYPRIHMRDDNGEDQELYK
jgi:hypothetical protein